ncbi:hypothetical protein CCP1ISM_20023 [Azospirillaceae bacterium]
MMPAIPKYVQVFKKIDANQVFTDAATIEKLIKIYEAGGIKIDSVYQAKNPTAKHKFMYVASKTPTIKGSKAKLDPNSSIGYWIYCGDWYVRKVEEKYEFGGYMAYETKTRKLVDYWDEAKFKALNEGTK